MDAVTLVAASEPFAWHGYLAWAMLGLGFASALVIVVDELVLGYRQHMAVMNLVHPITALYWGPVWVWAYFTRGRKSSTRWAHQEAERLLDDLGPAGARRRAGELREQGTSTDASNLRRFHVADADSHCGAGCTLGDILGEWVVLMFGIVWFGTWSGHQLPEEYLLDFAAAWTFGVLFQYFTIVPMRGGNPLTGIITAAKVDTASIVAFQAGLFGWMAIYMLVIWPHHGIRIDSPDFWFQMQIGMICGFVTAWPVNHWLVKRGIKEKMDHRRHLGMVLEQRAAEREREGDTEQASPRAEDEARAADRDLRPTRRTG